MCIFGTAHYAAAEKDPFVDFDQKKLLNYELQIYDHTIAADESNNQKQVYGVLLIDAPPPVVWEVLKNWELMAELVSDVEYYKTISELKPIQKDSLGQSFIECKVSIPLFEFLFSLDVQFDASNFRQEWHLIKPEDVKIYNLIGIPVKNPTDTIKNIYGYMVAESFDDGKKTVYKLTMTIEFSTVLPEFVERYMVEQLLTEHLEGVKKRVESHGLYAPSTFFELPF